MTELACCYVPAQHEPWQEPDPTAQSWVAAWNLGIRHIRMDYKLRDLQWLPAALKAALDGGFRKRIVLNMGLLFDRDGGDIDATLPAMVEQAAFDMVKKYADGQGGENDIAEAVSFENEPGGKKGMSPQAKVLDISQGGTFDWMKSVYGPLMLAFMRGARRANPNVTIHLCDGDSTDVQQRAMALLVGTEFENDPNILWCVHNYADIGGDPAKGIESDQDYSSMAGMKGKPGFIDVFNSDPLHRLWYISEISKSTGPFGGIATDGDMDRMIEYARYMLGTYPQCPVITIMQPKAFFARRPVWSARQPDITKPDADTWCTWTYNPEREPGTQHPLSTILNLPPIISVKGAQLATLFASINGPVTGGDVGHRQMGRRG